MPGILVGLKDLQLQAFAVHKTQFAKSIVECGSPSRVRCAANKSDLWNSSACAYPALPKNIRPAPIIKALLRAQLFGSSETRWRVVSARRGRGKIFLSATLSHAF